jgi:5-methyltetrahydropteroyltriglutamate--homocysteine methyltransferase
MFNATKDLVLPTTITGSIPRPAWYTENLAGRSFSSAMGTHVSTTMSRDAHGSPTQPSG